MRRYSQLTQEKRYQIFALKKAGHSQLLIAGFLGVHKSTISRDKRNRSQRGYRLLIQCVSATIARLKPRLERSTPGTGLPGEIC